MHKQVQLSHRSTFLSFAVVVIDAGKTARDAPAHRASRQSSASQGSGFPLADLHAVRRPAWSIYGAQRAQPAATGGKWDVLGNRSNRPIRNQWQPTATVPERMVNRPSSLFRRGSMVMRFGAARAWFTNHPPALPLRAPRRERARTRRRPSDSTGARLDPKDPRSLGNAAVRITRS